MTNRISLAARGVVELLNRLDRLEDAKAAGVKTIAGGVELELAPREA